MLEKLDEELLLVGLRLNQPNKNERIMAASTYGSRRDIDLSNVNGTYTNINMRDEG